MDSSYLPLQCCKIVGSEGKMHDGIRLHHILIKGAYFGEEAMAMALDIHGLNRCTNINYKLH